MRVSKRSWHFWLYNFSVDGDWLRPTTLCSYFWRVVLGLIKLLFTICTITTVALGLVSGAYFLVKFGAHYTHLHPKWVVLGCGTALTGCLVYRGTRRVVEKVREAPPSLIGEYIRAKKAHICPTIEFEA